VLREVLPDGDKAPDLSQLLALDTPEFEGLFHATTNEVGSLTDYILAEAVALREGAGPAPADQH
jgi:hypothetical protein